MEEIILLIVKLAQLVDCAASSLYQTTGNPAYPSLAKLFSAYSYREDGIPVKMIKKGSQISLRSAVEKTLAASDVLLALAQHEAPEQIVEWLEFYETLGQLREAAEALDEAADAQL